MNAAQATPHAELIAELMNPNNPKNEREHAAVREIERLREALAQPVQREWVSLTEWEREAIAVECGAMSADWLVFMEAVEKALKEKNL